MKHIRVRMAPSPTGRFHFGSARSALYNYLFAKKTGSKFILRIEDTDVARSTQESIQVILDAMTWLGMEKFGFRIYMLYQEGHPVKSAPATPAQSW